MSWKHRQPNLSSNILDGAIFLRVSMKKSMTYFVCPTIPCSLTEDAGIEFSDVMQPSYEQMTP